MEQLCHISAHVHLFLVQLSLFLQAEITCVFAADVYKVY